MSPMMFPFLGGMVPPLIKEKLGQAEKTTYVDQSPRINVAENQPLSPEAEAEAQRIFGRPVGIGNLQQGQMGPLSGLGQYLNQELAQENQGEVNEFIGEVGDMANQRFGVDLGSVGQRPMFDVGRPVQAYADGGAAFPDLSGDGKITQKDILMGRGVIGMQMGGDPMMAANMPPPQAPPMPMPAPEQAPMPMEASQDQLDPNVVQSALAQAAGGIGDLDQAQNYEQVMNTMRGDQATVEERRQELAGVVGAGDAGQTPESVLTLVQPVMMLANVDQGIGQLAQQEMTQPMEGPMAGGIMSTVPEPPPMEAGGTAPVNFNKGGEVRPIQNFANGGNVGFGDMRLNQLGVSLTDPSQTEPLVTNIVTQAKNQEEAQPGTGKNLINSFFQKRRDLYRQVGLGDPKARAALAEDQKRMTRAQMLFDIATTALAFAAPMEGERPGLSPAERLAMAARSTQLPEKIGARAQAQLQSQKEAAKEERAIDLAALQSAEAEATAAKAQAAAERLAGIKAKDTQKAQKSYITLKDTNIDGREVKKGTVVPLDPTQVSQLEFGDIAPYSADSAKPKKQYVTLKEILVGDQSIPTGSLVQLDSRQVNQIDPTAVKEYEKPSEDNFVNVELADGSVEIMELGSKKFLEAKGKGAKLAGKASVKEPEFVNLKVFDRLGEQSIKTVERGSDDFRKLIKEGATLASLDSVEERKLVNFKKGNQTKTVQEFSDEYYRLAREDWNLGDAPDKQLVNMQLGSDKKAVVIYSDEYYDLGQQGYVIASPGVAGKLVNMRKGSEVKTVSEFSQEQMDLVNQGYSITGTSSAPTAEFSTMILGSKEGGQSIIVKQMGLDLYDVEGNKIDLASEKYEGATIVSKDTAFKASRLAKSQADFAKLQEKLLREQSDGFVRGQILNPSSSTAIYLGEEMQGTQVASNTFDALRAARRGVGFWNKLKQVFSEVAGGVIPPLENVFANEVEAGNFIDAVNILTRVALANSPRFAEGEQTRLAQLLPSTDRLLANPENAVRKLIGIKKIMKQEQLQAASVLSSETDPSIIRQYKNQLYAIDSALKMLEAVPDEGYISNENFNQFYNEIKRARET